MSASSPEDNQEKELAEEGAVSDVVHPANAASTPAAGIMRAGEAGSKDDADRQAWKIQQGTDVIGACGHKIGEVMEVQDDYLVVEQGFFICHDLYVPKQAISNLDKHGLHLNMSKHDIKVAGWESEPTEIPAVSRS